MLRCSVKVGVSLPESRGKKRSELAVSVARSARARHTQNAPEPHVFCEIHKQKRPTERGWALNGGGPDKIRTCDREIRNLELYPAELRDLTQSSILAEPTS